MLKKIFGFLLVFVLFFLAVSAGFAVIKGLEKSKQSLVKVGESVTIPQGAELKGVVVVGGSATVYGQILEDLVVVGGSAFVKDSAIVGGDVVVVVGKIMKEPGAIIKGDVVEVSIGGFEPIVSFFVKGGILKGLAIFWVLNIIGFVVLTMILVALFTPQLGKVSASLEGNLLNNFIVGLIIAIFFFPVIILLIASLIGIVLIPVWIILVVVAGIFGYVASAHLLGKKTLHAFKIYNKSMMIEALIGVFILFLVGFIPVGGFLVKMIAMLSGLGGVYLTRFGTK